MTKSSRMIKVAYENETFLLSLEEHLLAVNYALTQAEITKSLIMKQATPIVGESSSGWYAIRASKRSYALAYESFIKKLKTDKDV